MKYSNFLANKEDGCLHKFSVAEFQLLFSLRDSLIVAEHKTDLTKRGPQPSLVTVTTIVNMHGRVAKPHFTM